MKKILWLGLLLLMGWSADANALLDPLPLNQAFTLSAAPFGPDTVILHWKIAPHHYLYRERFHFAVLTPAEAKTGHILFPAGQPKQDGVLGQYEVYQHEISLPIPITHPHPKNTLLEVKYQGCSEEGYCYPPATRTFSIHFDTGVVMDNANSPDPITQHNLTPPNSQQQIFLDLFSGKSAMALIFTFLGFGLLLSFTPCVLPMIPILSGIIVGHQKTPLRGKALRLSLAYVLSMASTYAIAGMLAGWLGASIQSAWQKPWVISLFSLLFVLLALSFFGLYSLKLPACFEERISHLSRRQKGGHYLGVVIMGCLATLIVSPCVTPALVGVLGYISHTGNVAWGGGALFAMGLGMGLPLLALGAASHRLLPKAGPWMSRIEYVFGVLFLGIAIWMLNRLLPAPLILLLCSALLIVCSVYLGALTLTPCTGWVKLQRGIGLVVLIHGVLLATGAAQGNHNFLQPLSSYQTDPSSPIKDRFIKVKSLLDVQSAVAAAQKQNKPVLLDFYASWCVSCQEMAESTFKDTAVLAKLVDFVTLQADVTANDALDRQLMQHFHVIAPPSFILFNAYGQHLTHATYGGKINPAEFLSYLQQGEM